MEIANIILYASFSLLKAIVKNCKTIMLTRDKPIIAAFIGGLNALIAINLIVMVVRMNIFITCAVAFIVNFIGCIAAMWICKKQNNSNN